MKKACLLFWKGLHPSMYSVLRSCSVPSPLAEGLGEQEARGTLSSKPSPVKMGKVKDGV